MAKEEDDGPIPTAAEMLEGLAEAEGLDLLSADMAALLDERDMLRKYRDEFHFPEAPPSAESRKGKGALYLCGNSLGLMPKRTRKYMEEELLKWEQQGVEGHMTEPRPWLIIDEYGREELARVVGAQVEEVCAMNSLTVNLHFLMAAFYRPSGRRHKILCEAKAFPSDTHVITSQIIHHGYDPVSSLIEVRPRAGEETLRTEDIVAAIKRAGDSLACVLFSGVQYYTGQKFDMAAITAAGHSVGATVGLDLAHAVGNVPLSLHDWGVDWAAWCSYKYLNSGPGAIGGAFLHSRHALARTPRLAGWWGHRRSDRFKMEPRFIPEVGIFGYRCSNPSVLAYAALRAALSLHDEVGMPMLRNKSKVLTAYLELLLAKLLPDRISVLTPRDPEARGAQLSLTLRDGNVRVPHGYLERAGVIVDCREPNVLRVAPAPMYNSFTDVWQFVALLAEALDYAAGQAAAAAARSSAKRRRGESSVDEGDDDDGEESKDAEDDDDAAADDAGAARKAKRVRRA